MKKWFIETTLVTFLIFLPGFVFGQSAKEAIRALKKLEAKTQVGVSYKDYGAALGDAQFELNMFLECAEAKLKPELAKSILKTMEHYTWGQLIWKIKFLGAYGGVKDYIDVNGSAFEKQVADQIFRLYPKAKERVDSQNSLYIDEVVSIIWNSASEELGKAVSLLAKNPN